MYPRPLECKKKMCKRIATLFCFLAFSACLPTLPVYAQQFFLGGQVPRFNQITRTHGLPNNAVSSVQQDKRGLMWFGTQGGLAKYDGRRFEYYTNVPFEDDSLPHNLVQTLYYDEAADTLWIGTYRGLARFRIGEPGLTSFSHDSDDPSTISNDIVIAITKDAEGSLWVGTQSGLNRMTSEGVFESVNSVSEVIRDLHVDSAGTLWVAGYQGLERWDPSTGTLVQVRDDLLTQNVMAIVESEPGTLLLACWGVGLVTYDVATDTTELTTFADDRLYAVLVGSDGTLWVGSWGGGLFAVAPDGKVYHFSDRNDTLSSQVIYSFYEDAAGLVWIGTNGGGLYRLSPRQRNYRAFYHDPERPGSLPSGKINTILRTNDGTLWVGTYEGGLGRYDAERNAWINYTYDPRDPYSLANDIVTELYEDSDGRLWVCSNRGLQRYDPSTDRFLTWGTHIHRTTPLTGEIIYAFLEDAEGDYWIGSYRRGVERFRRASGTLLHYDHDPRDPYSLSNDLVYDMLEDSLGSIWIATNGGVNRYVPELDGFQQFTYDMTNREGLSSNTVRILYEDRSQNLWMGTVSGGLNRFLRDRETFQHITAQDGLSNNTILGILEGADGRLWLSSQQGISSYDPGNGLIDVLDERDGLYGSEFHNGHFGEEDGTLFFGGGHGITRIDSALATQNSHVPRVQITDVRVFQESVDPHRPTFNGSEIRLQPGESFVGFEFVGIDYEAPQSNQYAYRLEKFDQDWIFSGTRNYATYTNLRPGTYTFLVKAANGDGVWSATPATLTLMVSAPWYRTWWAFGLYAIALLLIALAVFRFRESLILATQNRELEEANSKLAQANAELERLSIRDALTGAFNRRYFDAKLKEEWSRARRSEAPIALLMADVDRFKRYNDTHGHIAGDRCLVDVCDIMQRRLVRTTDAVARYGGEELAVLLYGTSLEGAREVAERLRAAVERENGEVTISIGVASTVPDDHTSPTDLIAAADAGLYEAKHAGRNRVASPPAGHQEAGT